MIATLAALLLAAEPVPVVVCEPGLKGDTMRADALKFSTVTFDNELRRIGVKVVQKCEGTDAAVTVSMQRLGKSGTQIDLEAKLADGTVVAARNVQAMGDLELVEFLRQGAREVANELFVKLGREPVTQAAEDLPPQPPEYTDPAPGFYVAVAGILVLGGGVAANLIGGQKLSLVRLGKPSTYGAAVDLASNAQLLANLGLATIIVGAVAAAAGLGYALVINRINASLDVHAFIGPNGLGGFVVGGHF